MKHTTSNISDAHDIDFNELQDQINEYRTNLLSTLEQDNQDSEISHYK